MRKLYILMLLLFPVCTLAQVTYEPAGTYRMEEIHTVQGQLQAAVIFARIPSDSDTQQITNLTVSPEDAVILDDPTGHEKCAVAIIGQPTDKLEVTLGYTVTCQIKKFDKEQLAQTEYAPYDLNDEEITTFLKPQHYIESDAPAIQKLGSEFSANFLNPYARVFAIYTWVMDYMTYEEIPGKGALWALERKRGQCAEYAKLFSAICRAAQIPARECSGIIPDHEDHFHSWAEFYLPQIGWIPCDPQMGDGGEQTRDACFAALPDARILQFQYRDFPVVVDFNTRTARLADAGEQAIAVSEHVCVYAGQGRHTARAIPKRQTELRHAVLLTHANSPRIYETDLDQASLLEADKKYRAEGAGCISLSITNASDELRWAAVWEPVTDSLPVIYPELTSSELDSILRDAISAGQMPISLSVCLQNDETVYSTVIAPSQGVQWRYLLDRPIDDFNRQVSAAQQSGQVATAITSYRQNETIRASGILTALPQRVSQGLGLWLAEDDLYNKLDQFDQYQIAPVSISATTDFPPFYSVAAMTMGPEYNWDLQVELTADQLKTVVSDATMQGLYPSRIVLY
jgi:hypothetical protein